MDPPWADGPWWYDDDYRKGVTMDIEQRVRRMVACVSMGRAERDLVVGDILALIREAVAEVTPSKGADYKAEAMAWRRLDFWGHVSPEDLRETYGRAASREMISDRHLQAQKELDAARARNEAAEAERKETPDEH